MWLFAPFDVEPPDAVHAWLMLMRDIDERPADKPVKTKKRRMMYSIAECTLCYPATYDEVLLENQLDMLRVDRTYSTKAFYNLRVFAQTKTSYLTSDAVN
jgi:hypothetical protein